MAWACFFFPPVACARRLKVELLMEALVVDPRLYRKKSIWLLVINTARALSLQVTKEHALLRVFACQCYWRQGYFVALCDVAVVLVLPLSPFCKLHPLPLDNCDALNRRRRCSCTAEATVATTTVGRFPQTAAEVVAQAMWTWISPRRP